MKCMGIAIKKNEVWYSVVEGTSMHTAIVSDKGKQNYRVTSQTLMMDFYNIFVELIAKYRPNRIAYKLFLDADIKQIPYMHYPLGILNLLCLQNGIGIAERSSKWITAGKKAKIERLMEYFEDNRFNNEEIAATLVAWYELGD